MRKTLLATLFTFCLYGTGVCQFSKVEPKVDKPRPSGRPDWVKPYKDEGYDYGSSTNPSPRTAAVIWNVDGSLYSFGGMGLDEKFQWGIFSDLWRYDPESNDWELLSEDRNNTASSAETKSDLPLARLDAVSWVDAENNLWLYGGRQLGESFHLDDLWKYDLGSRIWMRVNGKGEYNQPATRGELGELSKEFTPGSRSAALSWTDKKGNLWLFGGTGYLQDEPSGNAFYNDLWMFEPGSGQWAWISGSEKANQPSGVTSEKEPDKASYPGGRSKAAFWYDSANDHVWLYGGIGMDSTGSTIGGLSDLWLFSVYKKTWEFKGSSLKLDLASNIQSARTEAPGNHPGFRVGATSWLSEEGDLFLIGGHSTVSLDQVYLDKHIWAYSVKSSQWRMIYQGEYRPTTGAQAFRSKGKNLLIFGGNEFSSEYQQSRVSNSVWKFKP
jgi:N-acetylneuraminic acid mutarotase